LEPVHAAVGKIYRRRFSEIMEAEAGQKTVERLQSTVSKGLEYLVPLLEFSRLQQIYFSIKQQRGAAAGGRGAASVMPVRSLGLSLRHPPLLTSRCRRPILTSTWRSSTG
jgi:hypothetical protein